MSVCTKMSVSLPRRDLLELFQRLNFGSIEGLTIRGGEPMHREPGRDAVPTRILHEIKFAAENGPRPELQSPDFPLKRQWVELFAMFDYIANGRIESVEFKNGLPFKAIVATRGC